MLNYLNPLSESFILNGVITSIGNIISYLNPLSDNFILSNIITSLGNLLSYINPASENFFGYRIISLLGDLLTSLFVPSQERISSLSNVVTSKFSFIDTIKSFINDIKNVVINSEGSPTFTIHVNSTRFTNEQDLEIVNLSWYAPFKPYGDIVITGFVYVFFIWRLFIKLPSIISGTGGAVDDSVDIYEKYHTSGGGSK